MANYYKKSSETIVLIDVDYEKLGSLCNGMHPWNAQEELKHLINLLNSRVNTNFLHKAVVVAEYDQLKLTIRDRSISKDVLLYLYTALDVFPEVLKKFSEKKPSQSELLEYMDSVINYSYDKIKLDKELPNKDLKAESIGFKNKI